MKVRNFVIELEISELREMSLANKKMKLLFGYSILDIPQIVKSLGFEKREYKIDLKETGTSFVCFVAHFEKDVTIRLELLNGVKTISTDDAEKRTFAGVI